MIYPSQAVRIVIATKPVDFRKGVIVKSGVSGFPVMRRPDWYLWFLFRLGNGRR